MAALYIRLMLLVGALAHAAPTSAPPATARDPVVIAQFPNETWVENLAVRSNGKILATILYPDAAVYQIDPCAEHATPQLVANITKTSGLTGALGIAEYEPDVFAVVVSNFSLASVSAQPRSNKLWKINMTAFDAGQPSAKVSSKLADVPTAITLNGLVNSSPDGSILLATDSAGAIFSINTKTGTGHAVLSSQKGTPELGISNSSHAPLGPNGIAVFNRDIYVTNSNTQALLRFPLAADGNPASSKPQIHATFPTFVDDLIVSSDGTAFVASNPANGLDAVSPTGQERQILGGLNSSAIVGGTSVKFGRTPSMISTLYMGTSGGIAAPLNGTYIQGGQVIAIRTNRKGI